RWSVESAMEAAFGCWILPSPASTAHFGMIDAHHHLGPEPDYADRLRDEASRLGFAHVCLVGLPEWKWSWATNERVGAALRRHPDFLVGFAHVDPARDAPDAVERWFDRGFRGIKLIRPSLPFDDESYIPTYERAGRLGMPTLFHTGMVSRTPHDREMGVSSDHHRPVRVDRVARNVPEGIFIAAHLGHPWWDEASEACRLNANVFVDLSGPAMRVLGVEGLRRVLWWDASDDAGHHLIGKPVEGGAWRHVVFGSDVPFTRLEATVREYSGAFRALDVPDDVQAGVLGGTMRRLLAL
ncbi:MAG: amidohydrolase family protein, partial [Chloroflexi bacterium]|nr:amidohydrolase family protein [Chloroflexota bacterium]